MILSELCKYNQIIIQCHDNPDADSLASGYGLYCYFQKKGKNVRLVYSGSREIHKSNLRLMKDELNLPVEYIRPGTCEMKGDDSLLITVDCQYGSGNVTGIISDNVAVIDHHQLEKEARPMSIINSCAKPWNCIRYVCMACRFLQRCLMLASISWKKLSEIP